MSSKTFNGFLQLSEDMAAAARMAQPVVVRAALHAGGEIVTEAVKAEIRPHHRSGTLEENIVHEFDRETNTESIGWKGDGFYGKFMETGFTTRDGRYVADPAPHMRPGYEKSKEAALDAMYRMLSAAANTTK